VRGGGRGGPSRGKVSCQDKSPSMRRKKKKKRLEYNAWGNRRLLYENGPLARERNPKEKGEENGEDKGLLVYWGEKMLPLRGIFVPREGTDRGEKG